MSDFDCIGADEIDVSSPFFALAKTQEMAKAQEAAKPMSQTTKLAIVAGGVVAGIVALVLFARS